MIESALLQGTFKLTLAILGFLFARLGLLWMDRNIINDSEFGRRLNSWDSHAQSLYFTGRLLAVALVIGLALS